MSSYRRRAHTVDERSGDRIYVWSSHTCKVSDRGGFNNVASTSLPAGECGGDAQSGTVGVCDQHEEWRGVQHGRVKTRAREDHLRRLNDLGPYDLEGRVQTSEPVGLVHVSI